MPVTACELLYERVLPFYEALGVSVAAILSDYGPELTAATFIAWGRTNQVDARFIQPGKPDQNAFIERFNRTYREEVLDAYVFASINEVQQLTDEWLRSYNEERPHRALGRRPPTYFLPRPSNPRVQECRAYLTG